MATHLMVADGNKLGGCQWQLIGCLSIVSYQTVVSSNSPDDDYKDVRLLHLVVLTIADAPLDGPNPIDRDSRQRVHRREDRIVVDDDPDAAEDFAERPVVEEYVGRLEVHRQKGDDHVGERQVGDERREGRSQFLLRREDDDDEEVREEAGDDDEIHDDAEQDACRRDGSGWRKVACGYS